MIFFFSLSLGERTSQKSPRSEHGSFFFLGLFLGSLFVLTEINNSFLTGSDKLQLAMLCSGSSSFFIRTVHITWLIRLTIVKFCVRKLQVFLWDICILNLELLLSSTNNLYFFFSKSSRPPQIAVDTAAVAGSDVPSGLKTSCWELLLYVLFWCVILTVILLRPKGIRCSRGGNIICHILFEIHCCAFLGVARGFSFRQIIVCGWFNLWCD